MITSRTWTKESLAELIERRLGGAKLIVVSNREPHLHRYGEGGDLECVSTTGGLATALRPILAASQGTWIAHGAGNADRDTVDEHDRIAVPPANPCYTLRRVWLTPDQEEGYYYGFANEGLWPLCHIVFRRPVFRIANWNAYQEVNRIFAQAVIEEAGSGPAVVFIQDYHFCLLSRMIKEMGGTNLTVAQFWHIPWPNHEVFRTCPWSQELVDGLLGNDLLGFHTRNHCQNFFETVDRSFEAMVDREGWRVSRGGHITSVRPFPISIDFMANETLASSAEVDAAMGKWRKRLRLGDRLLGVGIERLDYTKGIPDRLRALDYFIERHPEWHGKFTFVQIAAPSRTHLPEYQAVDDEIEALIEQLNWRWGREGWQPVLFLKQQHGTVDMMALHRLCRFFIVNSLHDGMNLVAKEFVASRTDDDGVLILSKFTGASRELDAALAIHPFSIHETMAAIHQALVMDAEERARCMKSMREKVARNNVYRWAGSILSQLMNVDAVETAVNDDAALD
ncbi:MAG: trehalose-6-phosphate synthase [Prosthecobacter sp.]|jgi:trehalose-6-phosphate synthase|uniref:alpha,alpha-trehalose-phosphate synthase (UDP-forming) n=1 Tax=Prosthecobacter sp. TaxID=1965333 RepID=UPI0019E576B1|nr:trehalose-6-phosphate synthase [Prosthecobacter sp.]MBE2282409.1 trehalose-6-phosphate synthase [Prosthecobacter sp.]